MSKKPGTKWPAAKVEMWSIDTLKPYARNARLHSDEQVDQIVKAIEEWGWTVPVLADEDGGLIAGHGRLMAARKLGITEVPVMVARGWSEAQKRAYVIADNKLAENSEWDEALLKIELGDLQDAGEISLALTGFDEKELDGILLGDEDGGGNSPPGQGAPIIQFNIVFDDERQQALWFAFMRELKIAMPDEETFGARLARFLQDRANASH